MAERVGAHHVVSPLMRESLMDKDRDRRNGIRGSSDTAQV